MFHLHVASPQCLVTHSRPLVTLLYRPFAFGYPHPEGPDPRVRLARLLHHLQHQLPRCLLIPSASLPPARRRRLRPDSLSLAAGLCSTLAHSPIRPLAWPEEPTHPERHASTACKSHRPAPWRSARADVNRIGASQDPGYHILAFFGCAAALQLKRPACTGRCPYGIELQAPSSTLHRHRAPGTVHGTGGSWLMGCL